VRIMRWDEALAFRAVEAQHGSVEDFIVEVVYEHGIAGSDYAKIAAVSGVPLGCIAYLWRSSPMFKRLLDSALAEQAWGPGDRVRSYRALKTKADDDETKLADSVRAYEYLDRKVGVAVERDGGGRSGALSVNILVQQEVSSEGSHAPLAPPPLRVASSAPRGDRLSPSLGDGAGDGGGGAQAPQASREEAGTPTVDLIEVGG
jgi:hypothetical protein